MTAKPNQAGRSERSAHRFEHVFLARQDLSKQQVEDLAVEASRIVESQGGKVTRTETWGLKNLAYKIDRNRKAHFVMINIEGSGAVVEELERQTKVNEDIIRFLTVSVDDSGEGPAIVLRGPRSTRVRNAAKMEAAPATLAAGSSDLGDTYDALGGELQKLAENRQAYRQELRDAFTEGERLLKQAGL
jgi:small subunit ribosomal protein S6